MCRFIHFAPGKIRPPDTPPQQRASTNIVLFRASFIFGRDQLGVAATIVGRRLSHINNTGNLDQTDSMPAKIDLPSRPRPQPASEYIISVPTHHTKAANLSKRSHGRGESSLTFVPPDTTDIAIGQHILCHLDHVLSIARSANF